MVHELDYYNIPLAGILEQSIFDATESFLFVCAAGEEDDTSVWFYAPLSEEEIKSLVESDEDTLVANIAVALRDKQVLAALAQDWRIVSTSELDSGDQRPDELVRRFIKRALAGYQHTEKRLEGILRDADETDRRQFANV